MVIENNYIEADVLVIGGGIAGCCAALKAADHGLKVVLIDKSKIERSGSASQGIDHFGGFSEKKMTPEEFSEIRRILGPKAFFGGLDFADPTMIYKTVANRRWAALELEKYGVPMKWEDGGYHFIDTTYHNVGGGLSVLRVHWQNVKPILAKAVRDRGIKVLDRTMLVDLLTNNGSVSGATAVDTRSGEFFVIKAKATVMATAAFSRLYNPETPLPWKYKFRYHWCPASVSGDGWAAAYRAGAELANMEQAKRGYRFRDDLTLSFGNVRGDGIEVQTLTWDGKEISFVKDELESKGKLPFYYNFDHLPDDYHKRIEVAYADERLVSFPIAERRGFDPRTHRYEIMDNRSIDLLAAPGIAVDYNYRASLKGLYAVGDCAAGLHSVASASVSGLLLGDSINKLIDTSAGPVVDEGQVEKQKQTIFAPFSVRKGTEFTELECIIRYTCERYVGPQKSEGKLREGLRRLGSLKREFLPELMAADLHQLMRCFEVRNILELSEIHLQASLERKETRETFVRSDYREKDPSLDGLLIHQRLEDGNQLLEWRKIKPLDLALAE